MKKKRAADHAQSAPIDARTFANTLLGHVELHCATGDAAAAFHTAEEKMHAVVNVTRKMTGIESIEGNTVLAAHMRPAAPLLADLIMHPLTADPDDWQDTQLQEDDDAPDSGEFLYYFRTKEFEDVDAFRAGVHKFIVNHPALIPWSVFLLLLIGDSEDAIRPVVADSLERAHFPDVANIFFKLVNIPALPSIRVSVNPGQKIFMWYGGMSGAVSATERALSDAKVTKGSKRALFNACTGGEEMRSHRCLKLDATADGPYAVRTDPLVGDREQFIISCIRSPSLNSAPGGWRPNFIADDALWAQICEALAEAGIHTLGDNSDPKLVALVEMLTRYILDEVELLKKITGLPVISPKALKNLIKNAISVIRLYHGVVIKINIMKDISLSRLSWAHWRDL